MIRLLFFVSFLTMSKNLLAQLKIARLFSNNAVLQRYKPIVVWGWASANDDILVTLGAHTRQTKAATEGGAWRVTFDPLEAGTNYKLLVSNRKEKIEINNISIGEVWLCSGQSNMEWTVAQAQYFVEEQKKADFPQIRHFGVPHEVSLRPQPDLSAGHWQVCNPKTVGNFTAIGFFFARRLHRQLGVPVGIVHASWGGSHIEGWISREAMAESPLFEAAMQTLPTTWQEADSLLDKKLVQQIFKDKKNFYPTIQEENDYKNPNYDYENWITESPLYQWDWKGIWAFRGTGFMTKKIFVPKTMTTENTLLGLGENDSFNEIYINGILVFSGIQQGKRAIKIAPNIWQVGDNQLFIKFGAMKKLAWFGMGINGTAEDLYLKSATQTLSIAGNDWKLMPSFAEKHHYARLSNNVFTSIYNAMIAPLIPFSMQGVLWYQGESNIIRAEEYRYTFPLLINDWRKRWGDNFGFYFSQLSSFGENKSSNQGSGWAMLREAQTLALKLPKTGMSVSIDIGDPNDIHPKNKQEVAKRLFYSVLRKTYNLQANESPFLDSVQIRQDTALLSFQNAENGLLVKDNYGYIKGFEVAGKDCIFHYAKAIFVGDHQEKIQVFHPKGEQIISIRYAWADAPIDANVFNKAELPLCPFRTDDW